MSFKSCLLCLALLLAFSSAIEAFNITRLLGQYPELGLFNQHITEANLGDQINGRGTVTVLAVDNSSLSSISGRPKESIKAIISTHIVLDYFDEKKLKNLEDDQAQLTTLYQSSGKAQKLQGFINVVRSDDGEIFFGSAVQGAPLNAKLIETVTTQPYNISVLKVSEPIIPPGIDAQSPWPAPGAKTPLPSKKPESPAPSPDDETAADSPAEAESPTEAEAPQAESSTKAPAPAPAEEKAADDESQSPPPPPSSSTRTQVGTLMGFGALLVVLVL